MSDDVAKDWEEKAKVAFKKLSPKSGDIVTITVPQEIHPMQAELIRDYVVGAVQECLPDDVAVMIVEAGIDIKCLNADEMARLGWYKLATGDNGVKLCW